MVKRQKQVGGEKEAQLAIDIGDETHNEAQHNIYAATDSEYAYYSELINGFLSVIKHWQEIFMQEQHIYRCRPLQSTNTRFGEILTYESVHSHFEVLQTPEGLVISPINTPSAIKSNRVLYANTWNENTLPFEHPKEDTQRGSSHSQMTFKPGPAGQHLLVGLEGKPLQEVYIKVGSYWGGDNQQLEMDANYVQPRERSLDIKYAFKRDAVEVSKLFPYKRNSALMPGTYQVHLFDTINKLIPNPSLLQHRANQETPTKKLPRPGRRKPAQ